MALRPPYALPEDVFRLYDAQNILDSLTAAEVDLVRDAIDDTGSDFEVDTKHAFRLTRVGRSGTPSTYEYRRIEGDHRKPPLDVLLNRGQILPFDSTENDVLEYRSGRDDWTDITDDAGDEYTLYFDEGKVRLHRRLIQLIHWRARDDRYLRLSYRYGALGGRQDQGGQTTLDGSIDSQESTTSVSVTDAGRLPASGTLLVYGDNAEYVDLESVNLSTNTLTVSRGERSTDAASHSDGDTVHYCPEGFRMAVAAHAAVESQLYEMFTDRLVDTGQGIGASDRVEHWDDRYEKYKRKYSRVRKL